MDALMERIRSPEARAQRAGYSPEMKVALLFAGEELDELKAGIRSLKDCPGLATIAAAIHDANTTIKPADGSKDGL